MLIETKLRVPALQGGLIGRPVLLRQLAAALDVKLTIVSAPAGFGKTTLLSQWVAEQRNANVAVGWLSVEAADDEMGRFLDYFIAAVRRAEPSIAPDLPALLRSSPRLPVDSVLTTLVNDLSREGRNIALVLDDCHFLACAEIASFLDAFLTYAPPSFHLVLATRSQVPLKIGNMRVRGQMIRIDETGMRLSLAETSAFLNGARGLGLAESEIISLQHRTEGWIAALHLASLSLADRQDRASFIRRFSGTDRDVADFLVQDVLARLPQATFDFLLKTSVLDRICAPLADAVIGATGGQEHLAEIESANLFLVPLDSEKRWYRYHHLFAELLRSLLAKSSPEAVAELHRRASSWLSRHGFASDAVHHALNAGDLAMAAGLVESCCMLLIRQGHITRVREWLNSLPEDVVNGRPRLQLAKVWVLFHMSKPFPAASILKHARTAIAAAERQNLLSESERRELRAELWALTAGVISAADRSATAARLAQKWMTQFPEGQAFSKGALGNILGFCQFSLGNLEASRLACLRARDSHVQADSVLGVAYSDLILGLNAQAAAKLHLANEFFERATRHARTELGPGSYVEAMVGIFQVELLYEWNDLAAAEHHLQQHRQIIEECGLVVHEMACKLSVARLAAANGRSDEALAVLEAAERRGLRTRYRRLFASALNERIRLLLQRGDVDSARLVLKGRGIGETSFAKPTSQPLASELERMAVARLLIAEGRPEAAGRLLDRLGEKLRADGRLLRLIQVRALAAIAAHRSGDALGALAAVVDAVSLSASQGVTRSLVDEGAAFQEVVAFGITRMPSWRAGSELGQFVKGLMDQHKPADVAAAPPPHRFPTPQFTAKEADVMRLLSGGHSNRAIAANLAMAPDTVKWHLKNIFGKLSVSNRTQAVLRLQQLGLAQS